MSADYEILCDSADRVEWLNLRRTGIGASESPAVLSASPWSSPMAVFADKMDEEEPTDEPDERQFWGLELEPNILRAFGNITGRHVERAGKLLRSTRWPFMLATLDGWASHPNPNYAGTVPVDAKNTQDRAGWSDGVPQHVGIQLQHQMAVTGCPMASVAVLICGCEFKWRDVLRYDEFIEKTLVPECEAFWDRVKHGGPPPLPDASPATTKALSKLYPQDHGEEIALPGEFTDLHADLLQFKAALKENKASKDGIENQIRAALGEASFGVLPAGGRYSWLTAKNGVRTLRAPREE